MRARQISRGFWIRRVSFVQASASRCEFGAKVKRAGTRLEKRDDRLPCVRKSTNTIHINPSCKAPRQRWCSRNIFASHDDEVYSATMSEFGDIMRQLDSDQGIDAQRLFPLVYDELRKLASAKLRREALGQTLQPTALVHEAFLRLVDGEPATQWKSRKHFFAAAAEAMRRILVDSAKRKLRIKHGGTQQRIDLDASRLPCPAIEEDLVELDKNLLALDAALKQLSVEDPLAARLVELRHFGGMSNADAASVLEISPRTADRRWAYARAWLRRQLSQPPET
jgi:RNA polymerase sigma factor (TIGR02999 family)